MFKDLDDQSQSSHRLGMGGITTHLGKPAGKALSCLIGSALDIPAAWLDQQAQGIKDATAARSHVTQALATQTAKTAVTDPEIMERATANMVATAYRRQINKEAVALKTIKNLQADSPTRTG